jgi:hypothetical protein
VNHHEPGRTDEHFVPAMAMTEAAEAARLSIFTVTLPL